MSHPRTNRSRNQFRSRRLGLESLESRELLSATSMSFQVVDDAAANIAYRYDAAGAAQGSSALVAANAAPRGVASAVAMEKTWVIDANRNVYVYNTSGTLLGSWSAGSMANNATPEGIATNGADIWIVDAKSDKVFFYAGLASRLSGSQNATSSFNLASGNASPKGMVSDGASLWIVDDTAKTDKVFKYTATGGFVGSWTIDSANKAPTGIALDPANIGDLWISDSGTDRVYKYAAAAGRNSGSQPAASSFALATGNGNAQGLAVPGRPWAETPYAVEWVRQFGSAGDEVGRGVSADASGNIYVSGWTTGSLSVPNPTSETTPFLAKYDSDGNSPWVQQPIPIAGVNQYGAKVAADGLGNVFQVVAGGLNNYNAAGELVWNTPVPNGEVLHGVTADDLGYAYTSSYEGSSAHVRKFDAQTGNIVWERTLETGGFTNSSGVSVDGLGNVYLTGYTYGALIGPNAGGSDAFLAKYTDSGDLLWARQFGSPGNDNNFQVRADTLGNVYTSGGTYGSFPGAANAGGQDIFLSKHDAAGNLKWIRQWGTSGEDGDGKIWADGLGNVYLAGPSEGALGGPHLGGTDIVLAKYDSDGNQVWTTQIGRSGFEIPSGGGITGDDLGNLYITGRTTSSWGGPNKGGIDAVLIKLSPRGASANGSALNSIAVGAAFTSSDDLGNGIAMGSTNTSTPKRGTFVPAARPPLSAATNTVASNSLNLLIGSAGTIERTALRADSSDGSLPFDHTVTIDAAFATLDDAPGQKSLLKSRSRYDRADSAAAHTTVGNRRIGTSVSPPAARHLPAARRRSSRARTRQPPTNASAILKATISFHGRAAVPTICRTFALVCQGSNNAKYVATVDRTVVAERARFCCEYCLSQLKFSIDSFSVGPAPKWPSQTTAGAVMPNGSSSAGKLVPRRRASSTSRSIRCAFSSSLRLVSDVSSACSSLVRASACRLETSA